MKRSKALLAVIVGIAALVGTPAAKAAGRLCPTTCILEGSIEGTGVFPGDDVVQLFLPYTGIDFQDDVPKVSLGFVKIDAPMKLVPAAPAASPQVVVRSGKGTATVFDDNAASPDRIYDVRVRRAGTRTEGRLTVVAASVRSDLAAARTDFVSMELTYATVANVTTFVGSLQEQYDGTAPYVATPVDTFTVDAADIDGTMSTAVLDAGATYKFTASGVVDYDRIRTGRQLSDAECSLDDGGLTTAERASNEVPRWQPQRYFTVAGPESAAQTDLFDPDPTDDLTDLYVAGRGLDWVPADPALVNRVACNETDHTYVALFTPPTTGPVTVGLFDLQYADNGCATAGSCPNGTLTVSIERVSDTPAPGADGARVDSILLHSADADGHTTTPLEAGRRYEVEVRGMLKFQGNFNQAFYADAECARAGSSDNGLYRPHRYDGALGVADPLDVYLDGQAVDWEPIGRQASPADATQCSPLHAYRTTVVGTGAPLQLLLKDFDAKYGDNAGTLRVDVIEV